ncbi:MAG: ATP-binding protein [Steroidobacteraceae bacterium]
MSSLRKGLTAWLWVSVAIVGALCVLLGNWQVRRETQAQLDYQMQQVARILASQDYPTLTPPGELTSPDLTPSIYIHHDKDDDLIVTVRDANGGLLYASNSNRQLPAGLLPPLDLLGLQTLRLGKARYRVFGARTGLLRIQVAQSMDTIREAEGAIALATLLPIAVLLPVLAVVTGFAIRRQLRPLSMAAATLAQRPPLSLDLLPDEKMPAEVRPFVDEINCLLRRMRTAVEHEQRFVTDAAHALRTPLTALQLQAEILDGSSDPQEKAARLAELRAGIRRVARLSEQLLSLARNESESGPINVTIELDRMLMEVASLYRGAAEARGIDLQVEATSRARVYGSARRGTLIFGNLLDNSLRYTPRNGHICLRASAVDGHARIQLWDEGPGLPPEELGRVFERFYCGPGERGIGSGLGLATVKTLVGQLNGTVSLENRSDSQGLLATVTLPLAPQSQPPVCGHNPEVSMSSSAMLCTRHSGAGLGAL